MRHRSAATPSVATLARELVRLVRVCALSLLLVGGLAATMTAEVSPPVTAETAAASDLRRTMAAHTCSASGFGDRQVPASALVRTPDGRLRAVTFDRGWAVHQNRAPGRLVAVCLDEVTRLRAGLGSPQG